MKDYDFLSKKELTVDCFIIFGMCLFLLAVPIVGFWHIIKG